MTKHIYLCTDNRSHLPHYATLMASVLANTPGEIAFHIVHTGLTEEDRQSLERLYAHAPSSGVGHTTRMTAVGADLCVRPGEHIGSPLRHDAPLRATCPSSHTVTLHEIDEAHIRPWATTEGLERLSLGAYYRLVIPLIAPVDAGRALYLDYDIIADGDLSPLWAIDMEGKAIGMVRELLNPDWPDKCNSGVVLFNLDALRRLPYAHLITEYTATHRLPFHDESILNGAFAGNIHFLPTEYNIITPYLKFGNAIKHGIHKRLPRPAIIHYVMTKPWEVRCRNPLWHRYFRYRQQTAWRLPRAALLRFRATRFLKRLFDLERVYNDRRESRWQLRILFFFQFNLGKSK